MHNADQQYYSFEFVNMDYKWICFYFIKKNKDENPETSWSNNAARAETDNKNDFCYLQFWMKSKSTEKLSVLTGLHVQPTDLSQFKGWHNRNATMSANHSLSPTAEKKKTKKEQAGTARNEIVKVMQVDWNSNGPVQVRTNKRHRIVLCFQL